VAKVVDWKGSRLPRFVHAIREKGKLQNRVLMGKKKRRGEGIAAQPIGNLTRENRSHTVVSKKGEKKNQISLTGKKKNLKELLKRQLVCGGGGRASRGGGLREGKLGSRNKVNPASRGEKTGK